MRHILLPLALLAGCAGASTPAAAPSAAPTTSESCFPAVAGHPPDPAFEATGDRVVIEVEKGGTVHVGVRGEGGAPRGEDEVFGEGHKDEVRAAMLRQICRAGGVLGVPTSKEPVTAGDKATMSVAVFRAKAPSEADDVGRLCARPSILAKLKDSHLDADQERRVAAEAYDESLTTPRWRGFVARLTQELGAAKPDARPAIRARAAEELQRAAKPGCWLVESLRAP